MGEFYQIYIDPKPDVSLDEIEKNMNLALDWFRINKKYWIVYTSANQDTWFNRLSRFVEPEGSLFICKLQPDQSQGWLNRDFWDWLKSKRSGK